MTPTFSKLTVLFAGLFRHSQGSVLLHYETEYPDGDSYFILHNRNLTLTCTYDVSAVEVTWIVDTKTICFYSFGTVTKPSTEYKNRTIDYRYNDTEHRLTLLVDRDSDLDRMITCSIRLNATVFEQSVLHLEEILCKYNPISL